MVNFLFGVHRVRDNFYHVVSAVFVVSTGGSNVSDLLSTKLVQDVIRSTKTLK